MRGRLILAMSAVAALLVLVLARPAVGGGWATAELNSTPDGLRAGQEWVVDVTILQHGSAPLAGVKPAVRISATESERSSRFVARPTATTGVYRARVTFPAAGEWEYVVEDGFGQTHIYPPVAIADEAAALPVGAAEGGSEAAGGAGFRASALAGALAIGLAAAILTVAVRRRRQRGRVHPGTEVKPTSM